MPSRAGWSCGPRMRARGIGAPYSCTSWPISWTSASAGGGGWMPTLDGGRAGLASAHGRPITGRYLPDVGHQYRRNETALRVFNPRRWPVATKIIGLCLGASAALTIGLTAMGYLQARQGLQQQAQTALGLDAQIVTNAIDAWHVRRWHDLQVMADMPAIQRV